MALTERQWRAAVEVAVVELAEAVGIDPSDPKHPGIACLAQFRSEYLSETDAVAEEARRRHESFQSTIDAQEAAARAKFARDLAAARAAEEASERFAPPWSRMGKKK